MRAGPAGFCAGEAVFWFDVLSGRGVERDNLVVLLDALCPATDGTRQLAPQPSE